MPPVRWRGARVGEGKPGGQIGALKVQGRIPHSRRRRSERRIEGNLDQLTVAGGISAAGIGSDAVHAGDRAPDFTDSTLTSEDGKSSFTRPPNPPTAIRAAMWLRLGPLTPRSRDSPAWSSFWSPSWRRPGRSSLHGGLLPPHAGCWLAVLDGRT